MAATSSNDLFVATTIPSSFSIPIGEKLTASNYLLWKAQVMPTIHATQLEGFLTGAEVQPPKTLQENVEKEIVHRPNPAYAIWVARDQSVLGYLLSSLTKDVLKNVATCVTASEAWSALAEMYASQTRSRTVNTRIALATTRKEHRSMAEYYTKMRSHADEMAASGNRLSDDEFVSYVLAGLDGEYNSVVTAITACVEAITPAEMYTQLLSFESRLNLLSSSGSNSYNHNSSANNAYRGRGAPGGRSGGPGRGNNRGRNRPRGGGRASPGRSTEAPSRGPRLPCQVCFKTGHTAATCWYRFDADYVPEQRTAAAATSNYTGDPNWYTDTSATDHITGELDKLTMHDHYTGHDQIHAANGAGSHNEAGSAARTM